MATYDMQGIVDLARLPIEDADKDRYTDATLLLYAQNGLQFVLDNRPDLFFGSFTSLPDFDALILGDPFPLDDKYAQPIADYIISRVSGHDADHVVSGRVKLYYDSFLGGVM